MSYKVSLFILFLLMNISCLFGQQNREGFAIVFGLSQPIIFDGFNLAISHKTKKLTFEYSHGLGLKIPESLKGDELESQSADLEVVWTTGPGVGYNWFKNFDTRLEFKAHKNRVRFFDEINTDYITYNIGVGAYYRIFPFKKLGLVVEPSIRYWPLIGSTLEDDEFIYQFNGVNYTHVAENQDFIINVSIGWKF